MYNLIFFFILIINYGFGISVADLQDVSPTKYPHHALVKARLTCNGILLSKDFVLTPAVCVNGSKNATVFLGFSRYPYLSSNQKEPVTQIRQSSNILIHEDFTKLSSKHYINNVALIELSHPATINHKVRPARLISRHNIHLIDEEFVNITGWKKREDTSLKLATVRLRNEETCGFVFGPQYLKTQELCFRWNSKDHLDLVGNSVLLRNEVIGLQIPTLPINGCSSASTGTYMILSLIPFLNWIARKTGISEAQFIAQECNCGNDLSKLARTLSKQTADFQNQINISRTIANQERLELEARINSKISKLTNGLSAQISPNELEAFFNKFNKDSQKKTNEELNRLKEQLQGLQSRAKAVALENNSRFLQQQQNLSNLTSYTKQIVNDDNAYRDVVSNRLVYINQSLADLYTNQTWTNGQLHLIKQAYSEFENLWHQRFVNIEDKLDHFMKDEQRKFHAYDELQTNISKNVQQLWSSIKEMTNIDIPPAK